MSRTAVINRYFHLKSLNVWSCRRQYLLGCCAALHNRCSIAKQQIRRADKYISLVDEKTFHVIIGRHRDNWEVDFEIQALQLWFSVRRISVIARFIWRIVFIDLIVYSLVLSVGMIYTIYLYIVRVEVRVSSVGRDSVWGLGPVSGPGRALKGRVRGRNCWVSGTPSRWNQHHKSLESNSNVTTQMLPLYLALHA